MKSLPVPTVVALLLSACAHRMTMTAGTPALAPAATDWANAPVVTVELTDFAFTPDTPKFTAGKPVRLALTNHGTDVHDFSAPAFFATASFRDGEALPVNGDVALKKGQSTEIDLIPGKPGHYDLECTEFLHSAFGMTGAIDVAP